jgi:aryl-alcohol dehydrogenase-like predicted oxidoreductase
MAISECGTRFALRRLPVIDREVYPLGLAPNFGITEDETRAALDGPMNYVFWTPRMRKATGPVRDALHRNREHYVVATGPTTAWWSSNLSRFVDRTLKQLCIDQIDVLQMFWLGVTSRWTPENIEAMVKLRESGKVRAIGVSIHDRQKAGELAKDSPLDLLMVRYNAAHPGAETDIFPHLAPNRRSVIAYTATRWRKLLKRPRGWEGAVPTAGDCYRFCLSQPAVDVVLTGPKSAAQLQENLAAIERGPLTTEEMTWMREFGAVVHG